ncbi:hypothetical protein PoB_004088600 [Plakobranchus ocellatus]|uniref:Uncharacterized protein n=1 Tax=Plakobranchus ocellatus TaxID=259542 RepID=A0AAV4ATH8_9GAST|nr:hypothetical protein PoB_004088600 [Plakobranchus ocellatus]
MCAVEKSYNQGKTPTHFESLTVKERLEGDAIFTNETVQKTTAQADSFPSDLRAMLFPYGGIRICVYIKTLLSIWSFTTRAAASFTAGFHSRLQTQQTE